jgi:hypothetical protein
LKVDRKNKYGILEGVKLASQIMPLKNGRGGRKFILISNGKICFQPPTMVPFNRFLPF